MIWDFILFGYAVNFITFVFLTIHLIYATAVSNNPSKIALLELSLEKYKGVASKSNYCQVKNILMGVFFPYGWGYYVFTLYLMYFNSGKSILDDTIDYVEESYKDCLKRVDGESNDKG